MPDSFLVVALLKTSSKLIPNTRLELLLESMTPWLVPTGLMVYVRIIAAVCAKHCAVASWAGSATR